ncbi:MAG: alpha/beta fold hydrolase [Rhodovarius sp.]|nr:alpha/beta fold hydrolase [Rhodovarius sp.]
MILNVTESGAGRPVVLLHGLMGAAQNWGGLMRRLGREWRVLALDARNHGTSPHAPGMDYASMAADVAETLAAAGVAQAAVIGHSMGGKTAMMLALTRPGLVERLVVADIAPVAYRAPSRAYVEAMQRLDLRPGLTRRAAMAALEEAVPEEGVRAFLVQNLIFPTDGGAPRWRIGLDHIAAGMAEIEAFNPPPGAVYAGPTLVIRGSRSAYIQPEHEEVIRRLFPAARLATLPTGHWVHSEDPQGFLALIEPFLAEAVGGVVV